MKRFTSIAALTAFLLTAAACGDDSTESSDTDAPDTSQPDSSVPDTGAAATSPADTMPAGEVPTAIVSLSPTATEMLFAIGAGDQIIAVDQYSDYPAEALEKPHDLSGFEPNVEAIAAVEPDLVIMQGTTVVSPVVGQLEALGIPVWVGPAARTFDDVYTQIEQLGATTGHVGEAAELVAQMQTDIQAAVDAAAMPEAGLSYYHELDPLLYSVTGNTFIGEVYSLFGLENIADEVEPGNEYPQLNAEFIVGAAPDLIFLADGTCCGESAESVAARPGWDAIPAVQNGAVVVIDDAVASRWGPRIVDFITAVSDAVIAVSADA